MFNLTLPHQFIPRTYQLDVLTAFDSKNYNRFLLRWDRRSGKDKLCINIVVKAMFERVGIYYYLFPTFAQGRKALWEGIDKDGFKLLDHIPKELIKNINNNEMKIELINGSLFRVIGSDNYDAIMGTNPIGVVFSEFALQTPSAWEYISPILRQNDGWAIFNSTPRGKNHMYDLEMKNKVNPDWFISELQCLWPDLPNYYPVITLEDIQKEREAGMTEEMIEQEYGVSYIAGSKGAFYSDQLIRARQQGRIGNFPHNDHQWVDTFWDLGYRDDTAIWFRQVDGSRLIFIDYIEDRGKDLAYYVRMLQAKGYNYRAHYLPHDAEQGKFQAGLSHKDLLRQLCQQAGISDEIYVAERPKSKQVAIDMVRSRFSRYYFNEPLVNEAITKLSLYHREYDKKRQIFLPVPAHDWTSHCADALSTEGLTKEINDIDYYAAGKPDKIITDFDPLEY